MPLNAWTPPAIEPRILPDAISTIGDDLTVDTSLAMTDLPQSWARERTALSRKVAEFLSSASRRKPGPTCRRPRRRNSGPRLPPGGGAGHVPSAEAGRA